MAEKISIAIGLDGGDDIRKKLEALGSAGEKAFKGIEDAAKKPIFDPAQIDRTKQAIDQLVTAGTNLGNQFQTLTASADQFGAAGSSASQQVTAGLNQTNAAAQNAGNSIQQAAQQFSSAGASMAAGLISSANAYRLAALGIVAAITAVTNALTKGTVETGTAIAAQAEKLGLSIKQWLGLRQAIGGSTISIDDFLKGASKIPELMETAKGSVVRLGDMTTRFVTLADGTVISIISMNDKLKGTQTEGEKAAEALAKMGINAKTIFSGDALTAMREAAATINQIPDLTARAAAGVALFGKNWEQIVKTLLTGKVAADAAGKSFRDLSEADIGKTVKLKAAWEDLSAAIRAVKDRIGALFLDPALARAEWMVALIDGAHKLFIEWSKLSTLKEQGLFVAGLGESAAEQIFKILIALGQQLAGIWRDILVPAGQELMQIVGNISGSFEKVTTSQVVAFFITAAAAVIGLALALKGIGLVLTPLVALFSAVFSPFGLVLIAAAAAAALFWDQLKEGANSVLAIIPQQVEQIRAAIGLLFAGDFAGAWALFKEAAITALEDIGIALRTAKGIVGDFFRAITGEGVVEIPWVKTLVDGIKQIGIDIPGTIALIANAFIALGNAATGVADTINKIFGTSLTGTDIAAITIIAQMTGGLQALASVATIAAAAVSIFFGAVGIGIAVFGGMPALIGLAIAAVVAFGAALIALNWDTIASTGVAAWEALTSAIGRAYDGLLRWLGLRENAGGTPLEGGAPIGGPGGGIGSHARGGLLGGRGTGTSDSNIAWVSRGEHIMPARAVAQPGVLSFLEALRRSGGNLSRVLDGMGRFALGGMVPRPMMIPAFAGGGLAGGMSNVTIQFPGLPAISGLRASSDVVDQLHRAAALAQVRSGGRKPSRYS